MFFDSEEQLAWKMHESNQAGRHMNSKQNLHVSLLCQESCMPPGRTDTHSFSSFTLVKFELPRKGHLVLVLKYWGHQEWGHGSLVKHLPRTDVTAQNYDALYYWIVDGAWASQISPKASHLARKEFSIEPPKNTDPESHLWMFILRMFGEESLRVW